MPETREMTAMAELKFLADLSQPLVYVPSKGGGDQTEHQGNFRTHSVKVRDARRSLPTTDLDREGFVLLEQPSVVGDFYDDEALRRVSSKTSTRRAPVSALISAISSPW